MKVDDAAAVDPSVLPTSRARRPSAGLLLVSGGRLLVLQRSATSSNPLTWGLPGGRLDKGEENFDAAVRESVEELGPLPAMVVVGSVRFARGSGTYDVFVCRTSEQARESWLPQLCSEHVRYRWSKLRWCLNRRDKLHPVLRGLLADPRVIELIDLARVRGYSAPAPIEVDPASRRGLAKTL